MKKAILLGLVALFTSTLFSCSSQEETSSKPIVNNHELRVSPNGKDSVVYVTYQNPQTHYTENFFMDYMMFRMLFGTGGYPNVYNHYTSHPMTQVNTYSNYVRRDYEHPKPDIMVTSKESQNHLFSSPSRSYSPSSYSPPSRNVSNYSSSRSSSYSSPSRSSYSSPSRSSSYSSPSRSSYSSSSYSSSSRSYSSPSRSR